MRDIKQSESGRRLALLGAGRVGQTLGYLLKRRGYSIAAVISRTPSQARRAARFIGQGLASADPLILSAADWDLLLITTPDQAVAPTAQAVASYPLPWRQKTVLHCSGYLSSVVLRPLADRGAAVGSVHPLQTFARPREAIHAVRGSYFAVEGPARGVRVARRLIADLGGHAVAIPTDDKILYHCAAFLACGHLSALVAISVGLLGQTGISEPQAKAMLHPLIASTLENLLHLPIGQAITGPIRRGDIETVRAHLRRLAEADPGALAVYRQLGNKMVDLVKDSLSTREIQVLQRVLKRGRTS